MKLFTTTALAFGLAGGAAFAGSADDAMAEPPVAAPASAPQVDWSGHYGGGLLGFGNGSYDQGVSALDEVGPTVDIDGTLGGLRYGRNWQSADRVYGFDISLTSGIDGIAEQGTTSAPDWNCGTGDCNVAVDAMLTVRGRYGKTFNAGRTLGYGAAGLAAARFEGGIYNSAQQGDPETATGFTAGIGLEHLINDQFSVYGEANYVNLGTLDFGTDGFGETYDGEGDFFTVLFGVNYHF